MQGTHKNTVVMQKVSCLDFLKYLNNMLKKLTLAKAQATIKIISAINLVLMKTHSRLCYIRYEAKQVVDQHKTETAVSATSGTYTMPPAPSAYYALPGSAIGNGFSASLPNTITINAGNNKKVMVITKDGDVEWYGKPSEAARIMVHSLQIQVETTKGVTKAAKRRYYYMACKNLLNKSKTMKHEEFVDFLEKQVYNRESKIIWDALSNEN